jgi:hypothetical protein
MNKVAEFVNELHTMGHLMGIVVMVDVGELTIHIKLHDQFDGREDVFNYTHEDINKLVKLEETPKDIARDIINTFYAQNKKEEKMELLTKAEQLVGKTVKSISHKAYVSDEEIVISFTDNSYINIYASYNNVHINKDELSEKEMVKAGLLDEYPEYKEYLKLKERFE